MALTVIHANTVKYSRRSPLQNLSKKRNLSEKLRIKKTGPNLPDIQIRHQGAKKTKPDEQKGRM